MAGNLFPCYPKGGGYMKDLSVTNLAYALTDPLTSYIGFMNGVLRKHIEDYMSPTDQCIAAGLTKPVSKT